MRRKLFVFVRQRACGKRLGSAVSLGFPEKTDVVGCWIYKKNVPFPDKIEFAKKQDPHKKGNA